MKGSASVILLLEIIKLEGSMGSSPSHLMLPQRFISPEKSFRLVLIQAHDPSSLLQWQAKKDADTFLSLNKVLSWPQISSDQSGTECNKMFTKSFHRNIYIQSAPSGNTLE